MEYTLEAIVGRLRFQAESCRRRAAQLRKVVESDPSGAYLARAEELVAITRAEAFEDAICEFGAGPEFDSPMRAHFRKTMNSLLGASPQESKSTNASDS